MALDQIVEFFWLFKEFREFDLNWLTISSAILCLLVLFQIKALQNQACEVRKEQSGKSVSLEFFLYTFFLNSLALRYGFHADSFTVFLTGFTAPFLLWVVIELWRVKPTYLTHRVVASFGTAGIASLWWIPIEVVYTAAMIGTLIPIAKQMYEIYESQSPGVLEVSYFFTLWLKTIVWVIYVFALGDFLLQLYAPTLLAFVSIVIALWWWYHPNRWVATVNQIKSLFPARMRHYIALFFTTA